MYKTYYFIKKYNIYKVIHPLVLEFCFRLIKRLLWFGGMAAALLSLCFPASRIRFRILAWRFNGPYF